MSLKLTYFNLEAAAEKIRLACVVTNTVFEDNRISFDDWKELKPKTKYGQLPFLTEEGKEMYQSFALLKYIARKYGDDNLYPQDPVKLYAVEEALGLLDDFSKQWVPALYLGMGRHTSFGHPEEWPEKDATVKSMREKFAAEALPQFLKHLTTHIEANGGHFLCGENLTIADLAWVPQLRYFAKGIADHVPKEALDGFPVVTAYMARFMEIPSIKEWYAAHP
mmetsp:Transcript_37770/g.52446  ORF Transcript_37770/g.52446 Transcript_37770/m.52446 type:complete len:222 (-) Transcript_37770:159-824(-)|eukprot:CAMPEP_0196579608 /NCGR_PEP_ID=MMETSP1081-20130531/23409_1 /TAXON_ID=36882 /ORGANISM="Pyramimonas amylifera, Strain CCMP720" /LENGTH=221 /DNA_ID=CAMNT_0041899241 /DNA_START=51 /DNA_END=716 /DNA_ORIENTATION=+